LRLLDAFRLDRSARLALVGAGGKSAALFRLGREFSQPASQTGVDASPTRLPLNLTSPPRGVPGPAQTVLLAATTHLATAQLDLADHHFTLLSETDLAELLPNLPAGLLLFTGPAGDDQRTAGLPESVLGGLHRHADLNNLPLLIEADGASRRPLKAPAAHEPVIPPWVNTVVVVAGLSGLGQPLGPEWVHRPEEFSRLTGLAPGAPISAEALRRLLAHPQGGLKDIPGAARRVVLLNQADTPELQAAGHGLAQSLLQDYSGVVVAALTLSKNRSDNDLDSGVIATHEKVAGVILAAGGARRMGQTKQVLAWRGQPLVQHVARAALEAGLSPVIVVTGSDAKSVTAAVQDLPVHCVHNTDWQTGQSGSVKVGLQALPTETGAAVFLLADQPHTPPQLIASLVEAHAATLSPLVAPLVQGQRANPVLFDRLTFPELLLLSGDQGGRALFSRYWPHWVPWHDAAVLQDVDTPEDYRRLLDT
jgi:molybdenum cofactor cytidylyltransferase